MCINANLDRSLEDSTTIRHQNQNSTGRFRSFQIHVRVTILSLKTEIQNAKRNVVEKVGTGIEVSKTFFHIRHSSDTPQHISSLY